jgi:hypothetical protein
MKAQIFLSCGQNHEERPIAEAIKNKVEKSDLGFGCYVACEVQDLRDLRDIIFKRLEESDYFIFVDFKREELKKDKDGKLIYRGSLFANQELAVASYIGLGDCVLLLQEEGVERDGVLNAVLANLKEDETRFKSAEKDALPDRVYELIKTKLDNHEWTNQTRNTLTLSVYPHSQYLSREGGRIVFRPFHIQVENLHHRKDARNCLVYLDEVVNLTTNKKISHGWETAEFKWAHTKLAAVRITPKPSYRFFDAAWLFKNQGGIEMAFFNPFAPAHTDYYPYKLGPGKYCLAFSVISDNFDPVHKNFIFEFGQTLESGKLSEKN